MVNTKQLTTVKSASSINSKILLDIKPGVVEEKPTKPPGVPKFHRKNPGSPTHQQHGGVHLSMSTTGTPMGSTHPDKHNQNAATICQQMLIQGYVQSYVDFYHLTHRLDPVSSAAAEENNNGTNAAAASSSGNGPTTTVIHIPLDELNFIRDNLLTAEIARRQGDTANVYTAYTKLADYYVERKDWKTAFFFHEKCLEVAQLTNDLRAEMSANHSLGGINQLMQNYERARMHHERHEQLASSVEVYEEIAKANAELYKVYLILAEQKDILAHLDEALSLYQLCLESAKKSWDKTAEAEANGRIGSLMLHRGEIQQSIPFLKEQSQLAADLGHPESRCRACTSLALAYDQLGYQDKALAELTLVHSISEQAGDIFLQAQACKALGTMYSKMGKLDQAVDVLQRHFNLLKNILYRSQQNAAAAGKNGPSKPDDASKKMSSTDLDLARTYIGISKGNQMLGSYVISLQFDLASLLDWKMNRSELQKVKVPPTATGSKTEPLTSVEEDAANTADDEVAQVEGKDSA